MYHIYGFFKALNCVCCANQE